MTSLIVSQWVVTGAGYAMITLILLLFYDWVADKHRARMFRSSTYMMLVKSLVYALRRYRDSKKGDNDLYRDEYYRSVISALDELSQFDQKTETKGL